MTAVDDSTAPDPRRLRADMVRALRDQDAVISESVAAAFATVPRHRFAPEASLELAYDLHRIVPVKKDENGLNVSVMSVAHLQGVMLEQADIAPGMKVLEIGSGGYNAALIQELVGSNGEVTTVDIDRDIVDRARLCLDEAGYTQVKSAARNRRSGSGSAVGDGNGQAGARIAQPDAGRVVGRVFRGIGERLMDDPICRQVHSGGKGLDLSLGGDRDGGAGRFARCRQLGQTVLARSRFQRVGLRVSGLSHHPYRGLQLQQSGRRGSDQVGKDLLRLLRMARSKVGGGSGLRVGDRHVVSDHVVQFTCDPHALLGHAQPCLLLTGALGIRGARLHGPQIVMPQSRLAATDQWQEQPQHRTDRPKQQHVRIGPVQYAGGDHHGHDHQTVPARDRGVGADRQPVQRHHEGRQQQSGGQITHGPGGHRAGRDHGDGGQERGDPVVMRKIGTGNTERGAEGRAAEQRQDRHRLHDTGAALHKTLEVARHHASPARTAVSLVADVRNDGCVSCPGLCLGQPCHTRGQEVIPHLERLVRGLLGHGDAVFGCRVRATQPRHRKAVRPRRCREVATPGSSMSVLDSPPASTGRTCPVVVPLLAMPPTASAGPTTESAVRAEPSATPSV